tara:strand:- start:141578 stop:141718 length:141 start_codon:yes stop_codon:yes gene_type:complete
VKNSQVFSGLNTNFSITQITFFLFAGNWGATADVQEELPRIGISDF